ncbi:hypothetical protein Q7C36_012504 [Tachysurus vachellii]|uniref:Uncharacterized protein n=1 Tax=Tachysurus vachellii TaxID=175792 RepID=A0AA88MLC6_TACVA|nr:hypothetical protein Q7C36_012504 [Tachysurus vachellii]
MGNSGMKYPKPDHEETPRDWMNRCGLGCYTTPWLDNLAGWTESQPQFLTYPRGGTFKPEYLASAYIQIYDGFGDSDWDYQYMTDGYKKWLEMKPIWDKYHSIPKSKVELKSLSKFNPQITPKSPFASRTQLPLYNDKGPLATVATLYPSLSSVEPSVTSSAPVACCTAEITKNSLDIKTDTDARTKLQGTPGNDKTDTGTDNNGNAVSDSGSDINPPFFNATGQIINSPSKGDLRDIIKMLPSPSKPIHYVDMLLRATRHNQLTGADYRFILHATLGDNYDETDLIARVPCLDPSSDEIKTETKSEWSTIHHLYWTICTPDALPALKEQLTKYLLQRQQANRDLSQVTNCKQEKNESTSKFLTWFKETLTLLGGMELDENAANPLFLTTFMNNCRFEVQKVLNPLGPDHFVTLSEVLTCSYIWSFFSYFKTY